MNLCSFAVHKEHEMEIGYPTDVKHVAHIGLGTSDTSPSWVKNIITLQLFQLIFSATAYSIFFLSRVCCSPSFSTDCWCAWFISDGWIQGNRGFVSRPSEHSCAVKADFLGFCGWSSPLSLLSAYRLNIQSTKQTKRQKSDNICTRMKFLDDVPYDVPGTP